MCKQKTPRIYTPDPMQIFRLAGTSAASVLNSQITIPTPDARIKTTVNIVLAQDNQSALVVPFDTTMNGLVSTICCVQTAARLAGVYYPTVNLIGASQIEAALMQAIPLQTSTTFTQSNLCGLSLDIDGGQAAILVSITQQSLGLAGTKGLTTWLTLRYNLVGAEMSDDEWAAAIANMQPTSNKSVLV